MLRLSITMMALAAAAFCLGGVEPGIQPIFAQQQFEFFESRIRPVLIEHCYQCHNSTDADDGGLTLDDREGLLLGGGSGPAVVPGEPDNSLLMTAIRHLDDSIRMPKNNAKLSDSVIADFEKWIRAGAADPRDEPPSAKELANSISWDAIREQRMQWWSFQPIQEVEVPKRESDFPAANPVDRFIAQRLQQQGLKPAERADPRTRLRRLSFALTGLPPTPEEIEAFLVDDSKDAYQKQVDRMLASPQFGERWARHWMDWFRYADSHGSEGDPLIPYAWRYRDYLIRALNDDVRYDQLVREHLAGDLLKKPRLNHELGINESKIALAHFRFVEHGYGPTDALDEQVRFTDNQIDVMTKAFLGLTVSCARCHDHKFDPISQNDFYRFYGIMTSCRPTMMTIDTEQRLGKNRSELQSTKSELKRSLIQFWLDDLDDVKHRLEQLPTPSSPSQMADTNYRDQRDPEQRLIDTALANPRHPLHALAKFRQSHSESLRLEVWRELIGEYRASHKRLAQRTQARYRNRWVAGSASDNWFRSGNGLADDSTAAGAFRVALQGDQLISDILSAGIYTHLLSTRHNGVLTSPSFEVEDRELWVRVAGEGNSRLRYAMQHYPRVSGPVYQATNLNFRQPRWVRYDMTYWQGDRAYLEIATANDLPVEARNVERSWFGVTEMLTRNGEQPVPRDEIAETTAPLFEVAKLQGANGPAGPDALLKAYMQAIQDSLEAWQQDQISDAQSRFLNAMVRDQILENRVAAVHPEIRERVTHYRELEQELIVPTRVPGIIEGEVGDHPLFIRGNHKRPGDSVPRGYLEAFESSPFETAKSGRLELANRLTSPDNPLVPRVIVNRIWHHVFGRGLVRTTDNFGRLGEPPSHPELLDYLVNRFQQDGNSIKRLIRLLVTSETFQRSSMISAQVREQDPQNTWWSRMPVRRLEAEAIRDTMLRLAGELEPERFGPPVDQNASRRSVYVRQKRNALSPFLTAFDMPAPFSTKGARDVTNVPAQSLMLMNDPLVHRLAKAWAERVLNQSFPNDRQRITALVEQALGRPPSEIELQQLLGYLEDCRTTNRQFHHQQQRLTAQVSELERKRMALIEPVRDRILAGRQSESRVSQPVGPAPIAEWKFENDLSDSIGNLDGQAVGPIEIRDGRLVLDGRGYVRTSAVEQRIGAKTLMVRLTLSNREQRGSGVISLQTLDGRLFDAIVFAEQQPYHWMAGSNFFARTERFNGVAEPEQIFEQPTCIAIVYSEDGTIRGYRNGESYGRRYRKNALQCFEAGSAQVLLGMRHGTESSQMGLLSGAIEWARLYDRALTAEEVRAASSGDPNYVSRKQWLAAMTADARQQLLRWEAERDVARKKLVETKSQGVPEANAEWHELAKTLFNLKEFIYLR